MKKAKNIRYLFILTAIAFLMNAIIPFFAVYNLQQTTTAKPNQFTAAQNSSLFGDKVLICTADGFKWISWKNLQNGKEQPKQHPHYKCPLCYVAAHGTKQLLPSQNITIAYIPAIKQLTYVILTTSATHTQFLYGNRLSRAPPHSIIT